MSSCLLAFAQKSQNCRVLMLPGNEEKCDCSVLVGECKVDQQRVRCRAKGKDRTRTDSDQRFALRR